MILNDRMRECRAKCPALIHECQTYNIFYRTMSDIRYLFRSLEDILFLKKPWIFEVCHFTHGNSGQNKAFFTHGNSVKLCYTPWKFQGQKPRLMKMQHEFSLITPRNSTFTLGTSGQNKALLLEIL